MKWLNQTRKGKALLGAVFALACFVGAMCCAGVIGAAQQQCYDPGVASYYDTKDYIYFAERQANDLMSGYAAGTLERNYHLYDAEYTNLRFRITQVDANGIAGKITAENYTYDDTKTQFGAWYLFLVQDGDYTAQVMERARGKVLTDPETPLDAQQVELLCQTRAAAYKRLWNNVTLPADGAEESGLTQNAAPQDTPAQDAVTEASPVVYQLELRVIDPVRVDAYYAGGLKDGYETFNYLYKLRYEVVVGLALAAVAALVSLVALIAGTGRLRDKEGVVFGWFDRIPMEISFVLLAALGVLSAVLVWEFVPDFYDDLFYWVELPETARQTIAIGGLALVFTQWVCSAVAWLLALVRAAKSGHAFRGFITVRFIVWVTGWLSGAVSVLALVPKVSLLSIGLVGITVLEFLLICSNSYIRLNGLTSLLLLVLIPLWPAAVAYIIYGAVGMKKLDDCARMIAKGNYRVKVDTYLMPRHLCGHAQTLENIAAGLNDAVAERTKSERMKTELITNVSHDLKTPLTSIINYTDLLQSQPLPEKATEYAAVLARESARLKKLTEDLVEASKASSGAMNCEKQPTDLAELCGQALGEYAARLEGANLTPVTDLPAEGLWANVDGRLVWRTLDNLLGNACKYAMPGTRLYLTGRTEEGKATLEVKNISREPLNVSADELMARFVRGDASRSTEGSGLGLSIAQSLCQLQGGSFGLVVDGDLFKAGMTFAACAAPLPAVSEVLPQSIEKTE